MSKEIQTNVKGNNNCNIKINNIMAENDLLAKYNIVDSELKEKGKVESELSKRIELAQKTYNLQLPKELQNDFEIKPQLIGKNVQFITKPKTEDAYKKFPSKVRFNYKASDVKGLEKFKAKDFNSLCREMYEKQEGIIIENPFNIKELLGNIENPASIFSNDEKTAKSTIYIKPEPFPPAKIYTLKLYDNFIDFELTTLLRLRKIENDIYYISNYEAKDEKYNVEIEVNNKTNYVNLSISIKEQYSKDIETIRDYFKYFMLIRDKDSVFELILNENGKEFINGKDFGIKSLTERDYKKSQKNIDLLDKLIFIEKRKNIKFIFEKDIEDYRKIVDMLYNETIGKNYSFTNESTWILNVPENTFNINEFQKLYDNQIPFTLNTNINDFELLGNIINLKKHIFTIKKCIIISIKKNKNTYDVKIKTTNAKLKLIK